MNFHAALSPRSLLRVLRSGDSQRFSLDLNKDGPTVVATAASAIAQKSLGLSNFTVSDVRGKACASYPGDFATTILLRGIAVYLARRFRIHAQHRDRIIGGVVSSMMDATPYCIIRRDITSFYESIDHAELQKRLVYNTSIPRLVRHYLVRYFASHCDGKNYGLPRGIGLTSVLAEMAMQSFDREVRAIPGVYRYFRYSDDMIIFTYQDAARVAKILEDLLPDGMTFNSDKSYIVDYTSNAAPTTPVEYLGYRMIPLSGVGGREPRNVKVSISPQKVKRLKTRIILSLKRFSVDGNAKALLDRLRLISSNYQVRRQGNSIWSRGKRVRSGIYYNYKKCGVYAGAAFTPEVPTELSELDSFLHMLLKSPRSEFSARIKALNPSQLALLKRISFRQGFRTRRLVSLGYSRLAAARGVWRNA